MLFIISMGLGKLNETDCNGHSGSEIAMQIVSLRLSTTVAQAYNFILQVSSLELSAVSVPT